MSILDIIQYMFVRHGRYVRFSTSIFHERLDIEFNNKLICDSNYRSEISDVYYFTFRIQFKQRGIRRNSLKYISRY